MALVMRAIFIVAGAALLDAFHFTIYLFGLLLVATGIKLARHSSEEVHPERNIVLRGMKRIWPGTTVTAAVVVVLATTDLIFAIDSIPAIFAITEDRVHRLRGQCLCPPRPAVALLPPRGDDGPLRLPHPRTRDRSRLGRSEDAPHRRLEGSDMALAPRHRSSSSRARSAYRSSPRARRQPETSRPRHLNDHRGRSSPTTRRSSSASRAIPTRGSATSRPGVGITERAVQAIVNDLVEAGYVDRTSIGRRNHYAHPPRGSPAPSPPGRPRRRDAAPARAGSTGPRESRAARLRPPATRVSRHDGAMDHRPLPPTRRSLRHPRPRKVVRSAEPSHLPEQVAMLRDRGLPAIALGSIVAGAALWLSGNEQLGRHRPGRWVRSSCSCRS